MTHFGFVERGLCSRGSQVESDYLRSALSVTQLALRSRQAPVGDHAMVVLLVLLAELEMRWSALSDRSNLPTPDDIRALI
jgi:hypothetical protein